MSFNRAKTLPSSALGSLAQDIPLPADATDTISAVSWSPVANHLAAASWDGKVRIYDVDASTGAARAAALITTDGPLLDCDWAKDGTMVAAAGADKQCHVLHAATGQQAAIGAHDSPVRSVRFVEVPGANGVPIIASGSWDKTVRFWDLRQRDALAAVACNNRVFSMDSKARLLVVATAERHIHLFDLQNPTSIAKTLESPLRNQTKSVAAFPDGKGWATASIEGRCGINAVDEAEASSVNFTFRCHRDPPDLQQDTKVWSVNDVRFHPARDSVFTTAGSDGTFHFWDRIAHSRLRGYPAVGAPITATAFNHDGSCFAYAIGYDWSRGCVGNSPSIQTQLVLHPVTAEDTSPRRK